MPADEIYPGIHAAFEAIAAALQPLDRSAHDKTLVISASPGFAVKWLVPRLHRFLEQHPDIDTLPPGTERDVLKGLVVHIPLYADQPISSSFAPAQTASRPR
jgi:DNA-binding transcriptional LysR family regulator